MYSHYITIIPGIIIYLYLVFDLPPPLTNLKIAALDICLPIGTYICMLIKWNIPMLYYYNSKACHLISEVMLYCGLLYENCLGTCIHTCTCMVVILHYNCVHKYILLWTSVYKLSICACVCVHVCACWMYEHIHISNKVIVKLNWMTMTHAHVEQASMTSSGSLNYCIVENFRWYKNFI